MGIALGIFTKDNFITVYISYDDGDEGLLPAEYTKDNKFPFMFQVEIDEGSKVEVFKKAKDAVAFIKDNI